MRDQWTQARERDRRNARFCIRQRVAAGSTVYATTCSNNSSLGSPDLAIKEELRCILDQIHVGNRAFFSLSRINQHFDILSAWIPTDYLLQNLPEPQILSRLGEKRCHEVQEYLKTMKSLTLMEYSVLLGRYHVVSALLVGGINPCLRGSPQSQETTENQNVDRSMQQEHTQIANKVLQRFFNCFPVSLSSYIVKRVVQMRMASALNSSTPSPDAYGTTCRICNRSVSKSLQLLYTEEDGMPSCNCTFCEVCFWNDILAADKRTGNIVSCPCTDNDKPLHHVRFKLESDEEETITITSPQTRGMQSKRRFEELPLDSKCLKVSGRKKKKILELEALSTSWSIAVRPCLGLCQSVRRDKLFAYTEKNAIHFVRGALELGVDVNASNEYGQTPLYIAAWYGFQDLVQLLLHWGADPWVQANGELSLDGVCRAHGHLECLDIILQYRQDYWSKPTLPQSCQAPVNVTQFLASAPAETTLTVLIEEHMNHPGAGSYLISGALDDVQFLVDLHQRLFVDRSSAKTEKKLDTCSERSYFCDSEGWLRSSLSQCIVRAFQNNYCYRGLAMDVSVFPHMRFLHYRNQGSSLAPHIDLCRVDAHSGLRSTHSFLLYLTTCQHGGETILLQDVSGEGRGVMLAKVKPVFGSLLLFPHACPHEGNMVTEVPKLLIRGEVMLRISGQLY